MDKGIIAPGPGVDNDFDSVNGEIEAINDELQLYLDKQEKHFGCRLIYTGKDKNRYQIEIPDTNCKKVGSNFTLEGQKKGFKRYYTNETKVMSHTHCIILCTIFRCRSEDKCLRIRSNNFIRYRQIMVIMLF